MSMHCVSHTAKYATQKNGIAVDDKQTMALPYKMHWQQARGWGAEEGKMRVAAGGGQGSGQVQQGNKSN